MQNNRPIKIIKIVKTLLLVLVAILVFNSTVSFNQKTSVEANSARIVTISAPVVRAEDPNHFLTEMLTGQNPGGAWVKTIYNLFRGFLNIILLVVLLYVAFRNILHIDIDNYAIKKMLPKIIGVAVLGNLALPIFAVASSLVDKLGSVSIFSPKAIDVAFIIGGPAALTGIATGGAALLIAYIASTFFTLGVTLILSIPVACCSIIIISAPFVLTMGINLLLSVRPWIILIGAAIAPVAIGLAALPQTESISKRYLKIVGFWLFYPLLLYAIIYVILLVPSFGGAAGDGAMSSLIANLLPILIRFGLLVWAFRLPFLWEKDIAGLLARLPRQAYSAGKQVVGASLGAAALGGKLAYDRQNILQTRKGKAAATAASMAEEGRLAPASTVGARYRRFLGNNYDNSKEREGFLDGLAKEMHFPDRAHLEAEMAAGTPDGLDATRRLNQHKNESIEDAVEKRAGRVGDKAGMKAAIDFTKSGTYKLLEGVQRGNPGGILSAIKEKREFIAKDMEKAHYRKAKINELILGPAYNQKHQQAIQKEDQSHLHSLPDLEANVGPSFKKLVELVAKERGMTPELAAIRVQNTLKRLYDEQATSSKYVTEFEDVLGKKVNPSDPDEPSFSQKDFASVVEGFEHQRSLALQYARSSLRGRDVDVERESAVSGSFKRMMTSGAPTDLGARATQMTLGERRIAQLLTNVGQRVTASGTNTREAASLAARDVDGSEITSDEFNNLGFQGDHMLDGISKHLQTQGKSPQEIEGFLKELRESNAGPTPNLTGQIAGDGALQNMVDGYKTNRGVELTLLQRAQGSDARERMTTIIQRQQPDRQTIVSLQQQSTALVRGDATEAQKTAAVDYISKRLNLPKDTIDSSTAENITGALESMILRDREDRG